MLGVECIFGTFLSVSSGYKLQRFLARSDSKKGEKRSISLLYQFDGACNNVLTVRAICWHKAQNKSIYWWWWRVFMGDTKARKTTPIEIRQRRWLGQRRAQVLMINSEANRKPIGGLESVSTLPLTSTYRWGEPEIKRPCNANHG